MASTSDSMCGKPVGQGAVQYLCRLAPHEGQGPCVAPEVASSAVRRRQWEAEQGVGVKPDIVQSSPMVDIHQFSSHADRLIQAGESLRGDLAHLPPVIQSWMMGASAQLALVQLWSVWLKTQALGGTSLVLSADDINALVPEKLRL